MWSAVTVEVRAKNIIDAVKKMKKREREVFLEDLLASMSPDYLKGIREARADYKARRIKTHAKVFGVCDSVRFKTPELRSEKSKS